jgi:hypothetical protein
MECGVDFLKRERPSPRTPDSFLTVERKEMKRERERQREKVGKTSRRSFNTRPLNRFSLHLSASVRFQPLSPARSSCDKIIICSISDNNHNNDQKELEPGEAPTRRSIVRCKRLKGCNPK